jgi:hypothetical protein
MKVLCEGIPVTYKVIAQYGEITEVQAIRKTLNSKSKGFFILNGKRFDIEADESNPKALTIKFRFLELTDIVPEPKGIRVMLRKLYNLDGVDMTFKSIMDNLNVSKGCLFKITAKVSEIRVNGKLLKVTRAEYGTTSNGLNLTKGAVQHINITRKEAADIIGCSPSHAYLLAEEGKTTKNGWTVTKGKK